MNILLYRRIYRFTIYCHKDEGRGVDCCLNSMLMMILGWGHLIPGEKDESHPGDIVEKY